MNKKNITLVAIVFLSIVAGLLMGNLIARRSQLRGLPGDYSFLTKSFSKNKLDEVLSLIDQQYVDSIDVDKMTEEMMVDLIARLDPHSVYIPAADLENVNSELEGSFSGIGVQFNIQNDTITIVSVISGGPSEKVGLLAGDRIVEVNDTAFTGKKVTNEKVMKKLRGKANTKVKLGVKRHGTNEKLTYSVTRGQIPVNSVDVSYIIAPQTGFIKVSKFAATTYSEFLTAIADLRAKGARKYIIDLRENSGGFMDQAISMVNEFLPANQLIVYSEGKSYPRYEARANGKGSLIKAPVVVLIDEFSASASEIFAGAIQDNDRGMIIGRRSFGKGLVQQQMDLSDGSAIRLTVARYYIPSGRSIQKPYENGKSEDYELDILNRYIHGEIDNKDSVHLKDSLKYSTLKGRTVYGGGGVMPDYFVARDTSEYSPYLNKVVNYGYLYQFAFQYTDQHRKTLSAFKEWQKMEQHLLSQKLLQEFVIFAKSKGVTPTANDLSVSGDFIQRQLNAYITRNMIGENGFFPLFYKKDKTILKAIEILAKEK
ncbi:MAG: S41 family peptidase [Paludibacteraceae bacterium]|nr:S41 family peptidase [Paludibacteraceae bacterium]